MIREGGTIGHNSGEPFEFNHQFANKSAYHQFSQKLIKLALKAMGASRREYLLAIKETLEAAGKVINGERIYLFSYDPVRQAASLELEWSATGQMRFKGRKKSFLLKGSDEFETVLKTHLKKEGFFQTGTFNPYRSKGKTYLFTKEKENPCLLVPLLCEGEYFGFIGFEKADPGRSFSAEEGSMLQDLAELLGCFKKREKTEKERDLFNSRFKGLVETAGDWIWEIDTEGTITYTNNQVEKTTGYTPPEILGQSLFSLMATREAKKVEELLLAAITEGISLKQLEIKVKGKRGRTVYFETSGVPVLDEWDKVTGFRGISRDITERVVNRKKLDYLSTRDKLTGLYNRNFFEEELSRLSISREYPITVIYADVNGLKAVNDAFGHARGDELIKAAANILKSSLRRSELLARIGGDEFAAVLVRTEEKAGEKIVSRIRNKIAEYNMKSGALPLSISIGMATSSSGEKSLAELLKHADHLMYQDKALQKATGEYHVSSLSALLEPGGFFETEVSGKLMSLSKSLAEEIGLSKKRIARLELLVKFHNLGKTFISGKILEKQSKLTKEEKKMIRYHPEKGYHMALTSERISEVADLILKHHERWDGTGYPQGLKGTQIPIECRVFAVVDAYIAMTEGRPYKETLSSAGALEEIKKGAGTQFDPRVVKAFSRLAEKTGLASNNEAWPDS